VRRNDTVEERLRAALVGWPHGTPEGVDMSREAVERRLREACELSSLALALAAAGQRRVK
jgi:hypothetical protein